MDEVLGGLAVLPLAEGYEALSDGVDELRVALRGGSDVGNESGLEAADDERVVIGERGNLGIDGRLALGRLLACEPRRGPRPEPCEPRPRGKTQARLGRLNLPR